MRLVVVLGLVEAFSVGRLSATARRGGAVGAVEAVECISDTGCCDLRLCISGTVCGTGLARLVRLVVLLGLVEAFSVE